MKCPLTPIPLPIGNSMMKESDKSDSESFFASFELPSSKLTWQWKIPILKRKYIFKWLIFHCYVRLPECRYKGPFLGAKHPGKMVDHTSTIKGSTWGSPWKVAVTDSQFALPTRIPGTWNIGFMNGCFKWHVSKWGFPKMVVPPNHPF